MRRSGRLSRTSGLVVLAALGHILFTSSCTGLSPQTGVIVAPCMEGDSDPNTKVSFAKDIRPIMNGDVPGSGGCKPCHYEHEPSHVGLDESGLYMDELEDVRNGGNNTHDNMIVPGKACDSAIVQKLHGSFHIGARMPKNGPFWTDAQIQLMQDWIAEGALGDDHE